MLNALRHGVVLAIILACWSNYAAAEEKRLATGNDLLQMCSAERADPVSKALCNTYISGVIDGTIFERAKSNRDSRGQIDLARVRLFCPSDGVTNDQIHDVVARYLRENPSKRHLPAAVLLITALALAFPCE